MRRTLSALIAVAALAASGCGDDGLDYSLRTPPPYVGAAPIAPPGQHIVERTMTESDAEQLRPVIADWATAVREGDIGRAAGFFSLPAIVYTPGADALSVNSPEVVQAFNASLPCGAKLLTTKPDGRYVVGTFVLVDVGTQPCQSKGELARVGFVFGDKDHPRLFSEFWQLSTSPDAKPGPEERPRGATPATVSDFS